MVEYVISYGEKVTERKKELEEAVKKAMKKNNKQALMKACFEDGYYRGKIGAIKEMITWLEEAGEKGVFVMADLNGLRLKKEVV